MRMPKIDPEIIKLSKEMSAAKAKREKEESRRKWWRDNAVGLVGIAVAVITIVVSVLLDLN